MEKVFGRPESQTEKGTHYCPGCTHGIIHRLVAEVIDELGVERVVGVAPVGCAVTAYDYFHYDMTQAAHGRAPAVATGIKRVHPETVVFTYQGDGDLASIGAAEVVSAAMRGENITVVFINNAIFGMTGGQMAPTTLPGQKTSTSPYGRDPKHCGMPIRMAEMLATMESPGYIARVTVTSPQYIQQAKAALRKAFETQINNQGFSMVEFLSTCPTNWGMSPIEAIKWLEENMIPYYPLGEFKKPEEAK